jgi:hypothetical protein
MDWLQQVIIGLIVAAVVALIGWLWRRLSRPSWSFIFAGILVIILLLIVIFLLAVPSWEIIAFCLMGAIAVWMPVTLLLQKIMEWMTRRGKM